MSTDYVKVYGLPRSGTNYLQGLFRLNFPQVEFLVNDLGWKHGPHVDQRNWIERAGKRHELFGEHKGNGIHVLPTVHTVIVTKDLFAWLSSHCRFYFGENSPASRNENYLKDLVRHYCCMHRHWHEEFIEDAHESEGRIVRYEDLLMDFQNELFCLADNFKLAIPSRYVDYQAETSPSTDTEFLHKGKPFARKNYYVERSYMKEFPERLKKQIIEVMDDDLLQLLGYCQKEVHHGEART